MGDGTSLFIGRVANDFISAKTSGSSANLSFAHGDDIFRTASGTCIGILTAIDFPRVAWALRNSTTEED
ncbi:MAG: hypothetical protein LUC93_03880 [Planctomycetaceae bacterium]|nr:hypothetical protein [Planctomycetaceae bacterium]